MKKGVLLINLGTPSGCDATSVRHYLREFLSDPRVIDLPAFLRWCLLNFFILPFRPQRSADAYRKIWTTQGSPLLVNHRELQSALQRELGESFVVELGMRYGEPSISGAIDALMKQGCDAWIVLPLFPQYSSAATGSAMAKVFECLSKQWNIPSVTVINDFFESLDFIRCLSHSVEENTKDFPYDHLLMSYHGLPERHIEKSGCEKKQCSRDGICPAVNEQNRYCYRAQCFSTSKQLAQVLHLSDLQYSVAFQSRLGRTPWIKPYTDEWLSVLFQRGIRRLAVICPAFTADCLETLEEVAMRTQQQWMGMGGEAFHYIPALNANSEWVRVLTTWVHYEKNYFSQ